MASTNTFLTLYSTVQTNNVGSTIATGYIPYVSTAGRQAYSNTLSTLTVSTLRGNANCSTLNAVSTVTGDINCSTITANTINGTSATSLATTSYADTAAATAVSNKITLGTNQYYYSWTNLFGGTFTNNTRYSNFSGRVITVFMNVTLAGGNGPSAQAWVGGYNLDASDSRYTDYYYAAPGTPTAALTLKIIVPHGNYYKMGLANSTGGINQVDVLY